MRQATKLLPAAYILYMEFVFSQLKKMEVVSVSDGKNLGKVFDLSFDFPEGRIKGFFVTGCKGFKLTKSDEFIPLCNVVKVGEDVILVKTKEDKPPHKHPDKDCMPCPPNCIEPRRNFDEYE